MTEKITAGENIVDLFSKYNNTVETLNDRASGIFFATDYGAVGDGTTDDTAAIQGVIDAAPAGSTIVFPRLNYKILGTISITKKLTLDGNYSTITITENKPCFQIYESDQCIVTNFICVGSGKAPSPAKANQSFVYVYGGNRHQISNLIINQVSGNGIILVNTYGSLINQYPGSNIHNITLTKCNIGINLRSKSEYNNLTSINAFENAVAILDNSGNNNLCGFVFSWNDTHYKMESGANVGHGQITGGNMNHATTWSMDIDANATGMLVNSVSFAGGSNIRLTGGTKGMRFTGCLFDNGASGITMDGSTTIDNSFTDCTWLTSGVDPITKFAVTNSAKFVVEKMRRIDGKVFSFGRPVLESVQTAAFTINSSHDDQVIQVDTNAVGAFTGTLPVAATVVGREYTFVKVDASANAFTLDGNGSETINGAENQTLTTQYQVLRVRSISTGWLIV